MDCGPTCLRIIAKYYGKNYSLQTLREKCHVSREGVSLLGISDAAETIGFRTIGVKISFRQLCEDARLPCIVHWNQKHFVVVYKIEVSGERLSFMSRILPQVCSSILKPSSESHGSKPQMSSQELPCSWSRLRNSIQKEMIRNSDLIFPASSVTLSHTTSS